MKRTKQYFKSARRHIKNITSSIWANFTLFAVKRKIVNTVFNENIISFSLFGDNPLYLNSVDTCISSYRKYFMGWQIRIYLAGDVPEYVIQQLNDYGCEIFVMNSKGFDYRYTLWRFLAIDDLNIKRCLLRDIDSVASLREKHMVEAWIESDKKLHIIRDHPYHEAEIMAGMWGIKTDNQNQHMRSKMLWYTKDNTYSVDQRFLKKIYRKYISNALIHDVFKRFPHESPVIIPHDETFNYVGEISFAHPMKEKYKDLVRALYQHNQKH